MATRFLLPGLPIGVAAVAVVDFSASQPLGKFYGGEVPNLNSGILFNFLLRISHPLAISTLIGALRAINCLFLAHFKPSCDFWIYLTTEFTRTEPLYFPASSPKGLGPDDGVARLLY